MLSRAQQGDGAGRARCRIAPEQVVRWPSPHGWAAFPKDFPHGGQRKDTTARSRSAAIAKATEIVERLSRSAPTELGRATGAGLVAHYLDPAGGRRG